MIIILRGLLEEGKIDISKTYNLTHKSENWLPIERPDDSFTYGIGHTNVDVLINHCKVEYKEYNDNNEPVYDSSGTNFTDELSTILKSEISLLADYMTEAYGRDFSSMHIRTEVLPAYVTDNFNSLYERFVTDGYTFELIKYEGIPVGLVDKTKNDLNKFIPIYINYRAKYGSCLIKAMYEAVVDTSEALRNIIQNIKNRKATHIQERIEETKISMKQAMQALYEKKKLSYKLNQDLKIINSNKDVKSIAEEYKNKLETIKEWSNVRNVRLTSSRLIVKTGELEIKANTTEGTVRVPIGKITMSFDNMGEDYHVKITSDLPNINRIGGCLGTNLFHPHIYHDGNQCLGGYVTEINNLLSYDTLTDLVYAYLMFLQSINPADEAGADILKRTELEDFVACDRCGILIHKNNEVDNCPECSYKYASVYGEGELTRGVEVQSALKFKRGEIDNPNNSVECSDCCEIMPRDSAYEDSFFPGIYYCERCCVVLHNGNIASSEDDEIRSCDVCEEYYHIEDNIEFCEYTNEWVCSNCIDDSESYVRMYGGTIIPIDMAFECDHCSEWHNNNERVEFNDSNVCVSCHTWLLENQVQDEEENDEN